jgi:hypothetical protein
MSLLCLSFLTFISQSQWTEVEVRGRQADNDGMFQKMMFSAAPSSFSIQTIILHTPIHHNITTYHIIQKKTSRIIITSILAAAMRSALPIHQSSIHHVFKIILFCSDKRQQRENVAKMSNTVAY